MDPCMLQILGFYSHKNPGFHDINTMDLHRNPGFHKINTMDVY